MAQARPHIFLFYGADSYTINERLLLWLSEFKKKFGALHAVNLDMQRLADSPADTITLCKTRFQSQSLFSQTTLTIVKHAFAKKSNSAFREFFSEILPSIPATSFVVFVEESVDARANYLKTFKELEKQEKARIEQFEIPQGANLLKWVNAQLARIGAQMDPRTISYFLARYESTKKSFPPQELTYDLWQLAQEIKKLAAYANKKPIEKAHIDLLTTASSDAHVFDVIDAILSKNTRLCHVLLATILEGDPSAQKSAALGLVTLLRNQVKQFLVIKSMVSKRATEAQIADALSWNAKRVWVVTKKISGFSYEAFHSLYNELIDMEYTLKTSSVSPLLLGTLLVQKIGMYK